MKQLALITLLVVPLSLLTSGSALAADDSKVKAATGQVESGAKKIPDGKIGEGVEETAKGIGNTVSEGAKYSGEKLKEAGKAVEAQAAHVAAQAHERDATTAARRALGLDPNARWAAGVLEQTSQIRQVLGEGT